MPFVKCCIVIDTGGSEAEVKLRVDCNSNFETVEKQILQGISVLKSVPLTLSQLGFVDADGYSIQAASLVLAISSVSCSSSDMDPLHPTAPSTHLTGLVGEECCSWVGGQCSIRMKASLMPSASQPLVMEMQHAAPLQGPGTEGQVGYMK
jgi:hypothetical protein